MAAQMAAVARGGGGLRPSSSSNNKRQTRTAPQGNATAAASCRAGRAAAAQYYVAVAGPAAECVSLAGVSTAAAAMTDGRSTADARQSQQQQAAYMNAMAAYSSAMPPAYRSHNSAPEDIITRSRWDTLG